MEAIAVELQDNAILPWFDKWQIRPGARWQKELERQIENIRSASVFLGRNGIGPWQELEIEAFLLEFTRRKCPVIPVLLPSAESAPILPVFLRGVHWVDLRKPNSDNLHRLIWATISQ